MTVPIYVTTSDRYLPALLPFAHQLHKYWNPPPPVIVGGFTPPDFELPDNFSFLTIGDPAKYPMEKWTDAVRKMIESLTHQVFILMLEDYWVIEPVDVDAIFAVEELMKHDPKIIRFDLTLDRAKAGDHNIRHYGNLGPLELIQSKPHSPYHMSLICAMWQKHNLLKLLQPGWTPWNVEMEGTTVLSNHPDLKVLGTTSRLVPHTLAMRGGDSGKLLLDDLHPKDVDELRELGYLEPWELERA